MQDIQNKLTDFTTTPLHCIAIGKLITQHLNKKIKTAKLSLSRTSANIITSFRN